MGAPQASSTIEQSSQPEVGVGKMPTLPDLIQRAFPNLPSLPSQLPSTRRFEPARTLREHLQWIDTLEYPQSVKSMFGVRAIIGALPYLEHREIEKVAEQLPSSKFIDKQALVHALNANVHSALSKDNVDAARSSLHLLWNLKAHNSNPVSIKLAEIAYFKATCDGRMVQAKAQDLKQMAGGELGKKYPLLLAQGYAEEIMGAVISEVSGGKELLRKAMQLPKEQREAIASATIQSAIQLTAMKGFNESEIGPANLRFVVAALDNYTLSDAVRAPLLGLKSIVQLRQGGDFLSDYLTSDEWKRDQSAFVAARGRELALTLPVTETNRTLVHQAMMLESRAALALSFEYNLEPQLKSLRKATHDPDTRKKWEISKEFLTHLGFNETAALSMGTSAEHAKEALPRISDQLGLSEKERFAFEARAERIADEAQFDAVVGRLTEVGGYLAMAIPTGGKGGGKRGGRTPKGAGAAPPTPEFNLTEYLAQVGRLRAEKLRAAAATEAADITAESLYRRAIGPKYPTPEALTKLVTELERSEPALFAPRKAGAAEPLKVLPERVGDFMGRVAHHFDVQQMNEAGWNSSTFLKGSYMKRASSDAARAAISNWFDETVARLALAKPHAYVPEHLRAKPIYGPTTPAELLVTEGQHSGMWRAPAFIHRDIIEVMAKEWKTFTTTLPK